MLLRLSLAALCFAAASASVSAQVPDFYDERAYRTIYLQFNQANWWSLLVQNYGPEIDIPADMTVDGVTYPNCGVRFRGNTSYTMLPAGSEKKSFNIRTDTFVAGQDLYGYDNLNLNNGFHDPTFVREFLTYWVMRRHGPAPKANFVKLYLNGVYWGVYINVQQPNKDWAKEWFRSNDGNRYRGFPTSGTFGNGRCALTWLGSTVSSYLSAYQAKQGDGTDLMQLCNVLNNTPQAQLQAALPAWLNVDQFYRYASVMNIMTQDDSYIGSGKDHFLYRDEIHGDFHMFPFDLNEALAGSSSMNPWLNTTLTTKPAFSKTLVFPDWRERYDAHYRNILENSFSWAVLGPVITQYHAMIAPDVIADTKKIYSTTAFTQNLTQSVTVSEGGRTVTIPGLQPLITARDAFLRGQTEFNRVRVTLSNLAHAPSTPQINQPVTVTVTATANASSVQLWYRSVGPFTRTNMFDDGQHGDGAAADGMWGGSIPGFGPGAFVDYYVLATTAVGDMSFLPLNADFGARQYQLGWPTGTSPIVINEFVAQNTTGPVDENGQFEDWLELYNTSTGTVNVGGMWLTDDLSVTKFQIPAGTTIPAHGVLHVWCDEDGTQGPLHANFKLSTGGEAVGLFATDGQTLVDSIVFGLQTANVSTGRLYDGLPDWVTFPAPTPFLRNEIPVCGLRSYSPTVRGLHRMTLALSAQPQIGTSPNLTISGGPPAGLAGLALSLGGDAVDLGFVPIVLLLEASTIVGPITVGLDAQGAFTTVLPIANDPAMVGLSNFAQAFAIDAQGATASNGLEMKFCP
jgi:hypothetical protein